MSAPQHSWLFVCTGNLCRSPMAEGLFRAALAASGAPSEWRVDSAGTHAATGSAPAPLAVEVAAEFGADIAAQRSRPFEVRDFQHFGHIVALDRGHLDLIEFLRPEDYPGTVTMLPAADGSGVIEVPDPYGRARRAYVRAARLIADGIAVLMREAWPGEAPGRG